MPYGISTVVDRQMPFSGNAFLENAFLENAFSAIQEATDARPRARGPDRPLSTR